MLAHFGIKITPRRVYGLCRDLGTVCERNRARAEPELAVLVVRKSDRLPGDGFFHTAWRDGSYEGPATGPRARAYIDALTAAVFAFWAEPASGSDRPAIEGLRPAPASFRTGTWARPINRRALLRRRAPENRPQRLPRDRHQTVTPPSRSLIS